MRPSELVVGLVGGVLIVLAIGVATWLYGQRQYAKGQEAVRQEVLQSAHDQLQQLRAQDAARLNAMEEVVRETKQEMSQAQADAVAAAATSERLRRELDRVRASLTRPDAAASDGSPASGDPIGVLTELFSRADARAGELARIADAARIAGTACEVAYDAQKRLHTGSH